MTNEAETLARRWWADVVSRGDLAAIEHIVGPTCRAHGPTAPRRAGPEGLRRSAIALRAAFPDIQVGVQAASGDATMATTRWLARGTHEGEFLGVAPTGRRIEVEGITVFRCEAGRIAELWHHWDALGLLRQLGAGPAPENKAIVQHLVEDGLNLRNPRVIEEVFARDYLGHDPDRADARHYEDMLQALTMALGRVFPDGHYATERLLAEGDLVMWHWTFRGTHRGPVLGMPGTGRRVMFRGVNVFRLREGKVVEDWVYRDTAGMLRQIGVLPPMRPGRHKE